MTLAHVFNETTTLLMTNPVRMMAWYYIIDGYMALMTR
jgi:hypothetical protein